MYGSASAARLRPLVSLPSRVCRRCLHHQRGSSTALKVKDGEEEEEERQRNSFPSEFRDSTYSANSDGYGSAGRLAREGSTQPRAAQILRRLKEVEAQRRAINVRQTSASDNAE